MTDKGNEEKQEEFSFVTEQIQPSRGGKKRLVCKVAETILLAVIFGTVAGVTFTFIFSNFKQENAIKNEEKESVTIPRDEQPAASEEMSVQQNSQLLEEQGTKEQTTEESTQTVEEIVNKLLQKKELTVDDYSSLHTSLYEVVMRMNQTIVTVTSSQSEVDWFNNAYESSEETSGLIYNKTEKELLIMTNADSIHNANNISITFFDGTEVEADLRGMDTATEMAVLSVDTSKIEKSCFDKIKTATLGNSYTVKQGDPVIAIGNPMGYNYSMTYGVVTNIKNTTQSVDANLRLINTTALSDSSGNGFLINLKGEIVGTITREYKSESSSNIVTAIAISDMKGTLERLSNGQFIPYFGIIGQEVTAEVAEEMKLPFGIYVAEAIAGSPIYQAGIQSGDIIKSIDGNDVRTMKGLRNFLENYQGEGTVIVTILRAGREEYREIDVEVVLTEK